VYVQGSLIKLRIAVDVKIKKIISLEITDESAGDSGEFKSLVNDASEKGRITKMYANLAYDSRKTSICSIRLMLRLQ